ncbi:hypothetical protein LNQ81_17145 [Myroides sp. M-43]|uniref:hypothetical protein n=1 Tax=Myroides oncorhynchi TaxID=2893756 RepID=UPI001E582A62|nr:hypothetical protein [Myroides oncorhynchi]MCC9044402.1 hypothetical protein [Myroides oncorhynchi]
MRKRYIVLLTLVVLISIVLVFSETIIFKLVGLQEIEIFSQKDYDKSVEKIKEIYSDSAQFIVSTNEQFIGYSSLVESDKQYVLTKPIQILYFKQDNLVSFHSSCNVPLDYWTWKLNWNEENRFEQCPPKSSMPVLDIDLQQIKQLYHFSLEDEHQHTIIVFWSRLLKKQVYEAVRTVVKNKALYKEETPKLIFINVDQAFLGKTTIDEGE